MSIMLKFIVGMPSWLHSEPIKKLFPVFRFFLRFVGSSGTHGYRMGVYEDTRGFTNKDAAWLEDDLRIPFTWKSANGVEQSDNVPICFLKPIPPVASGDKTSRTAVIISREALGTVVKVKRSSKKGKFMAEPMQRDGGGGGSSSSRRFEIDKEDVCRVEYHDSQYEL